VTPRILIIAYGNPLRSDDGFAWHTAGLLREKLSSDNIEIVCLHQLTPELAESLSRAEDAIFLDARVDGKPGNIHWTPVPREAEGPACSHTLTPAQLLVLSDLLYGVAPEAYEVSVTGESFTHGEQLSHTVKNTLPRVVEIIDRITKQILLRPMERVAYGVGSALPERGARTISEKN
jgi:hydrogenase maturation protease